MRSFGLRGLLKALLVGSLVALQTGIGIAQIPSPINTGGTQDAVDSTVNTIPTIEDTTNTVNNTVTETNNTVNETVNTVNEVVPSPKPKLPAPKTSPITSPINTVGTVTGTVTGTAGGTVNTGTQDAISALGGATGQYQAPSASGTDVVAI